MGSARLEKKLIRPVAMFPYYERSHTVAYAGRRAGGVRDVKFAAGFARLCLDEESVFCKLLFPPVLLFGIRLDDITGLSKVEETGLLEVRFSKCALGRLTRFALSRKPDIPRDRVILNLGDDLDAWIAEISARTGTAVPGGG